MSIPRALLERWPERKRSAGLWRAATGEEVEARDLTRAYLRALAQVPPPERVFMELLAQGNFRAAIQFPLAKARREALQPRLIEMRAMSVAALESRLDWLQRRCRRVHRPDLLPKHAAETIRNQRDESAPRAQEELEAVEQALVEAEEFFENHLRQELADRVKGTTSQTSAQRTWRRAVERAIESKNYDIAENLLQSGSTVDVAGAFDSLPDRRVWPYAGYKPAEILSWLLTNHGATKDFYATWRPADDDAAAWNLLNALDVLHKRGHDDHTVAQFADALEIFLGAEPSPDRSLKAVPGGFRTVLRGLADAAAPALARVMSDDGLPVYVREAGGRLQLLQHDEGQPVIVFSVRPEAVATPGLLELHAHDLLSALPDAPHRRLNILRKIVPQLQVGYFRDAPSEDAPSLLHDRDRELGRLLGPEASPLQFFYGRPGVGISALLQSASNELARRSWEVLDLRTFITADGGELATGYAAAMQSGTSFEHFLAQRGRAGALVTSDGLDPFSQQQIPQLVRWSAQLSGAFRVMLTGDFAARDAMTAHLSGDQIWQLEAPTFQSMRAYLGRMLDMRGIRVSGDEALDQLAYYSGQRFALAHLLIAKIFELRERGIRPRGAPLTTKEVMDTVGVRNYSDVQNFAGALSFVTEARRWLLDPIERDNELRVTYAGTIAGLDANGSLWNHETLLTYREVYDFSCGDLIALDRFAMAVRRLSELGILGPETELDAQATLASGAIPLLCISLIGDPAAYMSKIAQENA